MGKDVKNLIILAKSPHYFEVDRFESFKKSFDFIDERIQLLGRESIKSIKITPIDETKFLEGSSSPTGIGYSERGRDIHYKFRVSICVKIQSDD